MKLAEALLLRADLQKKSQSLRERVVAMSVVQEGDSPHEDPVALLKQAFDVEEQLAKLVASVNLTNVAAKLPDGRTLTRAMADRDVLKAKHGLLQSAVAATRKEPSRFGAREIKWVAAVPVGKLQKQSEDLSKKLRELNARIQETNWKVEMKDD